MAPYGWIASKKHSRAYDIGRFHSEMRFLLRSGTKYRKGIQLDIDADIALSTRYDD